MSHERESARSKRVDPDTLPQKAPMKAGGAVRAPKISRSPSADQKKVRRRQRTAAKTICRACGEDMIAPASEQWPLCPQCARADAEGRKVQSSQIVRTSAYRSGFAEGESFGDSFISTDQAHPWNAMPHLRIRMMAHHVPQDMAQDDVGRFLAGFAAGVQAKQATVLQTSTDKLQPGDRILSPTGQTITVQRTRNHENSNDWLYLDTDAGTSLVKRTQPFTLSPHNTTQQEIPGFGIPGANTNSVPFGRNPETSSQVQSQTCPNCGAKGSMGRRGTNYVCSRCGYREQSGPLGKDVTLLDSDRVIRSFNSLDTTSAVARRAQEVLAHLEES